eukprot:1137566-Pelagomonas_calceolata.AAC.5
MAILTLPMTALPPVSNMLLKKLMRSKRTLHYIRTGTVKNTYYKGRDKAYLLGLPNGMAPWFDGTC